MMILAAGVDLACRVRAGVAQPRSVLPFRIISSWWDREGEKRQRSAVLLTPHHKEDGGLLWLFWS